MPYTIYFNQKPVVLTDQPTASAERLLQQPGLQLIEEPDSAALDGIMEELQNEKTTATVLVSKSPEALLEQFKKKFKVIEAGGGFVYTDAKTVLLIFRRGKWDLPKGKVDEGETIAAAAVREVEEETGMQNLNLLEPLTTTYHTYYQNGILILKESHWFMMQTTEQALVPQTEEDIEECMWVPVDKLAPYLQNTHPSIVDVLELGVKKIQVHTTF
jgi:8-oxo-dGTP pyrophosphatase MutT (NUDIX family)